MFIFFKIHVETNVQEMDIVKRVSVYAIISMSEHIVNKVILYNIE